MDAIEMMNQNFKVKKKNKKTWNSNITFWH